MAYKCFWRVTILSFSLVKTIFTSKIRNMTSVETPAPPKKTMLLLSLINFTNSSYIFLIPYFFNKMSYFLQCLFNFINRISIRASYVTLSTLTKGCTWNYSNLSSKRSLSQNSSELKPVDSILGNK